MTTTLPTTQHPPRRSRTIWIIGLTVLVLLAVSGAWFLVNWVFNRQTADLRADVTAAESSTVRITADNAGIEVSPSTDGQVHVHVTGSYSGKAPQVTAVQDGENVIVTVLCASGWMRYCDLDATVEVPSSSAVVVTTDNGAVGVERITGDLTVNTDNGDVSATEFGSETATVSLISDNGSLEVRGRAGSVTATTDNGDIDVSLGTVPDRVELRSDNGDIDLAVPGSAKYAVDSSTDRGTVKANVPVDSTSSHTIIAATNNGDVTVRPGS